MTESAPSQAEVLTFGCRLNAAESDVIRDLANGNADDAPIIVNSCAVTAEAERQVRQAIRRARRQHPERRLIVTGCAAEIDPDLYAAMPEVDLVLSNTDKLRAGSYRLGDAGQDAQDRDVQRAGPDTVLPVATAPEPGQRARAFVQVQNGCDHRCTFCIIPFGRGDSRSLPIGAIAEQVRRLVAHGFREVVLTGVDITSYGADLPGKPSLGQMVRRLLKAVPSLPRLRLSSIDAAEIDEDLWRLLAHEPRLMPHLHLSLQSGDNMILKRMKRRHSREDAIGFCDRARRVRPDVVFGADLIAGFPTETETMFRNTADLIAECGLTYLHVFPYSARTGTPAARMPQLPMDLRRDRARHLRNLGNTARVRFLETQIGSPAEIVVEQLQGTVATGHSQQFAPVAIETAGVDVSIGGLLRATVTASDGETLTATPLRQAA